MKGNFYVIIAPSGSGKTALVNAVTTNRGITTTSRRPREGELDKVDYYFVTKKKFEELIEKRSTNRMGTVWERREYAVLWFNRRGI